MDIEARWQGNMHFTCTVPSQHTISGERAETHPKKFTAMGIRYTVTKNRLTENELKQAIELSINKYCSVVASFAPATNTTRDFTLKN